MRSGFQQDILILYRHFLKLCNAKPEVLFTQPLRSSLASKIKAEFRAKQSLPRWSLDELDYLYNQGKVKLGQLKRYEVQAFSLYVPKTKQ